VLKSRGTLIRTKLGVTIKGGAAGVNRGELESRKVKRVIGEKRGNIQGYTSGQEGSFCWGVTWFHDSSTL